jgi:hypothetical protein
MSSWIRGLRAGASRQNEVHLNNGTALVSDGRARRDGATAKQKGRKDTDANESLG